MGAATGRRVTLMLWSAGCLPGYHLPFVAGADGVFSRRGLDVAITGSPAGPARVEALADGAGDFCLTAVHYYLQALERRGSVDARFVSVIHGRSPVAAIVRADSGIVDPAGLRGRPVAAGGGLGWLVAECEARLEALGIEPGPRRPIGYSEAPAALAAGAVDAMVSFAELAPLLERSAGVPLAIVDVGIPAYGSGLIARAGLDDGVVASMQAAVRDCLELQERSPRRGVTELVAAHPHVSADEAAASWRILQPYTRAAGLPGAMDRSGWVSTIEWSARVHGLPAPAADEIAHLDDSGRTRGRGAA